MPRTDHLSVNPLASTTLSCPETLGIIEQVLEQTRSSHHCDPCVAIEQIERKIQRSAPKMTPCLLDELTNIVQHTSQEEDSGDYWDQKRLSAIRIRMVASLMGLDGGKNRNEMQTIHWRIRHLDGGLEYGIFDNLVVLLPPEVKSKYDEEVLLSALEELFEITACRYRWIVDCSSIRTFSGLLFGNLIFYQDRLVEAGQNLYLHWLRDGILTENKMHVLQRVLRLVKIGGQYFSSESASA